MVDKMAERKIIEKVVEAKLKSGQSKLDADKWREVLLSVVLSNQFSLILAGIFLLE